MSKLTSKKLRQLILKEFQKMEEDALRMAHDDPGRQSYVASKGHSCYECGYMMKEEETVCEQCGSMYEEDLNEGACGCPPTCEGCNTCSEPSEKYSPGSYDVLDYDSDNDFVPDHMEQPNMNFQNFTESDIEDLILNAISADIHSQEDILEPGEAFGVGHSVGKSHHRGAYMAKKQMYKVAKYAQKIYQMIPDGHNLEDWMRTKLAQISDDISEVYHALDHDKFEGDI